MSLFGIVFVVLLVLKLAEIGAVAAWSGWAVTAPLWAPWLVVGALGLFAWTVKEIANWRSRRAYLARQMKE